MYKDRAEMLTIMQLNRSIDSVQKMLNQLAHERHKAEMKAYLPFMQYGQWMGEGEGAGFERRTLFIKTPPDSARVSVIDQSISFTSSLKSTLDGAATDYENRREGLRITP